MARVYFAKCGDKVRIGVASDAEAKMSRMRQEMPEQVELLASFPGDEGDAERTRSSLRKEQLRGEWFKASRPVLNYAAAVREHNPQRAHSQSSARRFSSKTQFGRFMHEHKLTPSEVAEALGISRAYVLMMAAGTATPRLGLAFRIEDWALKNDGQVSVESWREFCR